MSDLVKRLREGEAEFPVIIENPAIIMREAADRITELEAQVRELQLFPTRLQQELNEAADRITELEGVIAAISTCCSIRSVTVLLDRYYKTQEQNEAPTVNQV